MSAPGVSIVHPFDPAAPGLGGFDTCIGDFIAYAPTDWHIEVIGVTSNSSARPVGRPTIIMVGERPIRFVAAMAEPEPDRVRRIPLSLRFAAACRLRGLQPSGRVVQLHRFESVLAVPTPADRHKCVLYLHNDPMKLIGSGGDVRWRGLRAVYWAVLDRSLARADHVYVVDAGSRAGLVERSDLNPKNVRHLPIWADPRIFHAAPGQAEGQPPEFPQPAPILIYAGRFERQKNLSLMLDAVKACHLRGTHYGLVMVGKGRDEKELRQQVADLELTNWVAIQAPVSRAALAGLYRASDVAVCSSHFESGPRHLLEALACGASIASTAVGLVPEVLSSFPQAGELAEAHHAGALADAIDGALAKRRIAGRDPCLQAAAGYDPVRILQPVYERYQRWMQPEALRDPPSQAQRGNRI